MCGQRTHNFPHVKHNENAFLDPCLSQKPPLKDLKVSQYSKNLPQKIPKILCNPKI